MTFDSNKYKQEYGKEKYARFLVDLPKKEKEEFDRILKENHLSKAEFLRQAIKDFKKKKTK